jgi:LytS/YehU family sensor histidine kinase
VIAYVRYRERLVKNKQQQESEVSRKLMELEKRALQAQMNPHFIYNSMNSIQQFILMHDTEGAMKYLTRFSRILRTVLNMSSQSRIPLYEEIKLIEDYIELESMRFPNKFTYNIDVSPELNIHAVEIPPFFIQPQVENAIRHGLLRKETPGYLHIELLKEGDNLHITVEDNGIGREASRASKFNEVNKHESKGLGIIEERLKYLNSPNGHEPFKIIDLYDAERKSIGTRVEITLPMD